MKYFVTGGTGFIGSWVVKKLVDKGESVVCLIRKTSNLRWVKDLPIEFITGSLFESSTYRKTLREADVILHIAGVTKALTSKEYYRGNVEATRFLLQTVQQVNPKIKKFVHISSQAAVGPSPTPEPIDETFPCNPITDYGKSKLASEELVKKYMDIFPVTIIRPPAVYGPRDTDVFEVFKSVYKGINLKVGFKEQIVSIIHVWDLVSGILLAAEHPDSTGQIFFVANDDPYRWNDVIEILKNIMGKKVINFSVPFFLAYGVASFIEMVAKIKRQPTILNRQKIIEVKQPYWVVSNRKITKMLGYHPEVSLEQGLRLTYEWYLQNHWLK